MDQMAGTDPLHVLLTSCPLAQCSAQTVLPKLTYVTVSHWLAPQSGTTLHPTLRGIRKMAGSGWAASPCLCWKFGIEPCPGHSNAKTQAIRTYLITLMQKAD